LSINAEAQVSDSHCAGSVVNGEDQYTISWIGRPLVKLASETPVTLDAATGSYSLPEVCENLDDHVDLDLTGMLEHITHVVTIVDR
jgi:hypothetical protein